MRNSRFHNAQGILSFKVSQKTCTLALKVSQKTEYTFTQNVTDDSAYLHSKVLHKTVCAHT